eukprot:TRINITY_DN2537_c0_g1_i2.p1 TRINITY_DN2537_c0_g1~~TRINITY_DN2537_c0_g1_i2.p1  ORF type:complete len:475 (+),score=139.44 TRINITY_DN2537_c0_g1_i2:121-1545(+)
MCIRDRYQRRVHGDVFQIIQKIIYIKMVFSTEVQKIWDEVIHRDPHQKEFLQAVEEVLETLEPVFKKNPKYLNVMRQLIEPERAIQFRVPWMNKEGGLEINRGFRVQYNSAIGPYKGGCRFHPSVNLSIIKFLGFEQIFKNSLTTLPMGGGKGGSDFDPKGKTDEEVMRFCQSFMLELGRHIGENTDVPAGDIGVGGREIGYMFGQFKRINNKFVGVLTGKGQGWGGSLIRPEATGYGTVYFTNNVLVGMGDSLKGKRVTVSGSGNVAIYAIEKLLDFGAIPITASDSAGHVYLEDGFTREALAALNQLKTVERKRISEFPKVAGVKCEYVEGKRPWARKCDIALPCATQNEIEKADAEALIAGGCKGVCEGANMPSTPEAVELYHKNNVFFGAAKAANAGGVAVSGLEMTQNSMRLGWSREEVDEKLKKIMQDIYDNSAKYAKEYNTHLQAGSNIAGFVKVADAMLAHGCVQI